jgi:hypothetical protein
MLVVPAEVRIRSADFLDKKGFASEMHLSMPEIPALLLGFLSEISSIDRTGSGRANSLITRN